MSAGGNHLLGGGTAEAGAAACLRLPDTLLPDLAGCLARLGSEASEAVSSAAEGSRLASERLSANSGMALGAGLGRDVEPWPGSSTSPGWLAEAPGSAAAVRACRPGVAVV